MQVIVDLDSIMRYESGMIFGVVYIQANTLAYPAVDWTDFIGATLSWWAHAVNAFQYLKPKETVELRFMDGHTAQAQFTSHGQSTTSIDYEQIVDMDLFKESLKKCIRQVVNKSYREGWQDRDVTSLQTALKRLSN